MQFLIKQPPVLIASDQNIWDNITIIVALDSLHNNFSTITKSMLKWKDKTINKIWQILASTEVKFISKHVMGVNKDLVIISKSRNLIKQKVDSKDKYSNYR